MVHASGPDQGPEDIPELEHVDEALPPGGPGAADAASGGPRSPLDILAARSMAGLPAPAFHPGSHKEYYRFLFAGVLVLVGCLMPFGPQPQPGYYSISGGVMLVIAIGVVWSMWGAINTGVFRMKWVLLMFIPFVWSLMHLIKAGEAEAVVAWIKENPEKHVEGWGAFFRSLVNRRDPDRFLKCSGFIQALGAGKILIFLGSLLAEFHFFLAIFGGLRRAKAQKAERRRS